MPMDVEIKQRLNRIEERNMATKQSLSDRLKHVGKSTSVSMVPEKILPPPKKEEDAPDIRDLITSSADRLKILRLSEEIVELGEAEKVAKKAKEPLVLQLKKLLGDNEVGRATVGDYKLVYYNCPRHTLSKEKLLEHGVKPAIIEDSMVHKDVYTLKVSRLGQEEDE